MSASANANKLTFAVIGDSAAFGTGDEMPDGSTRGWAYYLANSFQWDCEYLNFARPGAKSDEVATTQLSLVKEKQPDICAVIAGGNDLLRNGFDPDTLYTNLRTTCDQLMAQGSEVIMFELHDPNRLLPIPKLLKRVLRRRVEAVNAVYQKLANELDLVLIRTREIPDVHDLSNWHVDRMHPGPLGHHLLATEMASALAGRGWKVETPKREATITYSRRQKIAWMVVKGTPWFFKRSFDLLPVALFLMAIESVKVVGGGIRKLRLRIRQLPGNRRDEQLIPHDLHIARNNDLAKSYQSQIQFRASNYHQAMWR